MDASPALSTSGRAQRENFEPFQGYHCLPLATREKENGRNMSTLDDPSRAFTSLSN
jgi:hypothetical protein